MQSDTLSLYLHIPFCDSKCGYCAFNSKTNKDHLKLLYMQKLAVYLRDKLTNLQEDLSIQITSVYIGGGTPNVVESYLYADVFNEFLPFLKSGAEISIEANPNHLSLEWLRAMRAFGVNRLSLGVQSFDVQKLAFLERDHNNKNTFLAIDYAQNVGFNNLSIDLIYGTPLCSELLLENELNIALKLPLSHISAYHLSLDPGSRFYKDRVHMEFQKCFEGEFGGFLSIGHFVEAHLQKFLHYEVSNYGKISMHNLHYWRGGDYIGIGAGAVGCIKGVRTRMPNSIERFLEGFSEKKEILTLQDRELEHLLLGFRSCVGVETKKILDQKKLELLLQEGVLFKKGERVFAKDYFLGDEIVLFLS